MVKTPIFHCFSFLGLLPVLTFCWGPLVIAQDFPNKTDATFFKLKSNLERAEQGNTPQEIAQAHQELGEFYRTSGIFSAAMDQYGMALGQMEAKNDHILKVALNNSIGKVHLSLNKFKLAKNYFQDALKTSHLLDYLQGQAISKGLLGACYEKQGDYAQALEYQRESLALFQKLRDSHGIALVNENIGSIYEDLERYALAHDFFGKSYAFLKNTGTREEVNVLNNLGDVYRKQGLYDAAITETEKALLLAQRIQDNHQLESAHKDLSKAYALQGEYRKAHHHLTKAGEYNSTLIQARNTEQLNVLQTIHESNKKEAQIQLLKEQNKVSKANQNVLWIAIFAIAAVLIILYTYLGRKRKAQLKLQEYRQRTLKAELDKKGIEEKNLQREVQLKTAALSRYSLHLSQKNKILLDLSNTLKNIAGRKNMDMCAKIKDLVKDIDFNLQQEQEWDEFMRFFKEIHPDFIKKLSSISEHHLSPAEMRLGMLLRLNMSSKEIASVLRVTPDSVRVARYRLRKKLPIGQKAELVNFMVEL
ncbi:MAG: tetratricopeptide repeat protein [Bacteroidota bacterium]